MVLIYDNTISDPGYPDVKQKKLFSVISLTYKNPVNVILTDDKLSGFQNFTSALNGKATN